jgi:hypothetical protein
VKERDIISSDLQKSDSHGFLLDYVFAKTLKLFNISCEGEKGQKMKTI